MDKRALFDAVYRDNSGFTPNEEGFDDEVKDCLYFSFGLGMDRKIFFETPEVDKFLNDFLCPFKFFFVEF